MNDQPPPELEKRQPERPWFDKPRGRLQPNEIDDYDRRLGRDKPKRKLFL